jgi:aspartyl-tRNA synthetase
MPRSLTRADRNALFPPDNPAFSLVNPSFDMTIHRYRTHTCGALTAADAGNNVRLSGWVHRVRDHGGLLFIDLRDHYGITQCVIDPDSAAFAQAEKVRSEWVLRIDGEVKLRDAAAVNSNIPTGAIEIFIRRHSFALSLPRFAPRKAAQQYRQAHQDHFLYARWHGWGRVH